MSTTKTTQQLARELADIIGWRNCFDVQDVQTSMQEWGAWIPEHLFEPITKGIKAEIDKEAASIKKALQEALANE